MQKLRIPLITRVCKSLCSSMRLDTRAYQTITKFPRQRDLFSYSQLSYRANKNLDLYADIVSKQHDRNQHSEHFKYLDMHLSKENDYIYNYVHKQLHESLKLFEKEASDLPVASKVARLREICDQEPVKERRNKLFGEEIASILAEIKEELSVMNQIELACLINDIKHYRESEFHNVKTLIDMELRWLLKKHVNTRLMDLNLWLYIADIYYDCKIKSTFNHVLLNYIVTSKDVSMSRRQLLHVLFLVILKRQENGLLSKYEDKIADLIPHATVEDLSIICLAYFKTKTRMRNLSMIKKIIKLTKQHIPKMDPVQPGFVAVFKVLRYSLNVDLRDDIIELVEQILDYEDWHILKASPFNFVHFVKLLEAYRIYRPKLLSYYWDQIFSSMDVFRTKDIQYALTSLNNLGFMDLKLDKKKIEDLDRYVDRTIKLEFDEPKLRQLYHIVPVARALAVFGFYRASFNEFLSKCMNDSTTIRELQTVLEFEKSILLYHSANHIEAPSVKLDIDLAVLQKISESIARVAIFAGPARPSSFENLRFVLQGDHKFKYSSLFRRIANSLSDRDEFRDRDYKFNFQLTMPHQNYADLVISYKADNPGSFDADTLLPKSVPPGENHVLIFCLHGYDYVDGLDRIVGNKTFLIRLLSKLGYKVVTVDFDRPDFDQTSKEILKLLSTEAS